MRETIKKSVSVILAASLFMTALSLGASAAGTEPKLYQTYGDQMLFGQNRDIVIAGTSAPGSTVTCEITLDGQVVRQASAQTKSDGTFSVVMDGIDGGYTEYTVLCKFNGELFDTLKNVIFGELWIAAGQSNMQMSMGQSKEGAAMIANGESGSKWVRFLNIPAQPEYKGSINNIPLEPQNDVKGAYWCNGSQRRAYDTSAVGFFFGEKLRRDLDVPVGVISLALGGSSIYSWLPREAVEGDPEVLADAKDVGVYFSASDWKESNQNTFRDITSNYNNKVYATKNFKPSGMIWYQGESNIGSPYGRYKRAFDLMQTSYSELFGFENGGMLPIVFTQLATFHYGSNKTLLPQMNMEFAEIQKALPQYRALVSIYDIELTYTPEIHSIHPLAKKPIGERMAYSAMGFLYGSYNTYTVPYVKSHEVRDGAVYVTFNNVGDGLTVKQSGRYITPDPIYGCTICGENGVFVEADAEIVSADTIRIYSAEVPSPIAATYAYSETNVTSNLYSSSDGATVFGVSPFTTRLIENAQHIQTTDWANCEIQSRWHSNDNTYSGEFGTWGNLVNSSVTFNYDDVFKGAASLQLDALAARFGVAPVMHYEKDGLLKNHLDIDTCYSQFGTVGFMVKNIGTTDVTFDMLKIYVTPVLWFAPVVKDANVTCFVIPADGSWHRVTLDLSTLYLFGRDNDFKGSRFDLREIYDLRLCFTGAGTSSVLLDDFVFTPAETSASFNFFDFGSVLTYVFSAIQPIFDFFARMNVFFSKLF